MTDEELRTQTRSTLAATSRARRSSYTPAANGSKWIRPSTRWAIYYRDDFVCVYCGRISTPLSLDHVVGVESGGSNAASNLVTCCVKCNSSKQGLGKRAWFKRLRARGVNTEQVRHRIARLIKKSLDRKRGSFLAATRERHMGTSVVMIKSWYDDGKNKGATHMLVLRDTFGHGDYPIYVMPGQNVEAVKAAKVGSDNLQKLMMGYALHKSFNQQESNGHFAMDFSSGPQVPLRAVRKLLVASWTDIDFRYDELTDVEKAAVSEEDFNALAAWAQC